MGRFTLLSLLAAAAVAALLAAGGAAAPGSRPTGPRVEVVVGLVQPGLAYATFRERTLMSTPHRRLDLRAPASVSYVRTLASEQDAVANRIRALVPGAEIRWRYRIVLDGLAVVLPRSELARLARVPGVAVVYPQAIYHSLRADAEVSLIRADALWGPTLSTAGNGMKIGIVDDGVDQSHPFLDPSGFHYPAGYPKGQTQFTTPKVIVARAFAPASETWKYANAPFDPLESDHATHVAGIAAGDYATRAAGHTISGVAPNAYIGNYKVLTVPTRDFGLDGNAPEIAAGIEAAVADGMNVINLSLGEPEIEPSRDVVVKAIDGAAAAGVVPVIAAGNEFEDNGRGSVSSPANAPDAITVAASTGENAAPTDVIASFSSSGPTPLSYEMKPDVTAPGVQVLSSVPPREGTWQQWDGTSMASPHVAGAAALLMERHPTWTVEQIKSALESTGDPVYADTGRTREVPATREGGGRIDLVRADQPLLFTDPTGISFGLMRAGQTATRTLSLADAGGGAGAWNVSLAQQTADPAVTLSVPATASVPGTLTITATVGAGAAETDLTGFVLLGRGDQTRRVPYWLRVEAPKLAGEHATLLTKPGLHQGDTRGKPSIVSSYRYPERSGSLATRLDGPEQVFRIVLTKPVANVGVAIVSQARGVSIQPRFVRNDDENQVTGDAGYPAYLNPYGAIFGAADPVVGAVLPAPGTYDAVFDTESAARAGAFTFRFWINDVTPPAIRLLSRTGGRAVFAVTDRGSGVDPRSLAATVDGRRASFRWSGGRLTVPAARGTHTIVVVASDYQEAKNMEDVGPVLPNTRVLRTRVRIG